MRLGEIRPGLQRALQRRAGLGRLGRGRIGIGPQQHIGQQVVERGITRMPGQLPAKQGDRLGQAIRLAEDEAQADRSVELVGAERTGLLEVTHGLVDLPPLRSDRAAHRIEPGRPGDVREPGVHHLEGQVERVVLDAEGGEIDVMTFVRRRDLGGLAQGGDGGLELAGGRARGGEEAQQLRVRRAHGQTRGRGGGRLRGLARLEPTHGQVVTRGGVAGRCFHQPQEDVAGLSRPLQPQQATRVLGERKPVLAKRGAAPVEMRHRVGARVCLYRQGPGHGVRGFVARLAREDALHEASGLGAVRAISHLGGAFQRGKRVRVERERTLEAGQALREPPEPFQRDGADGPEPGIAGL